MIDDAMRRSALALLPPETALLTGPAGCELFALAAQSPDARFRTCAFGEPFPAGWSPTHILVEGLDRTDLTSTLRALAEQAPNAHLLALVANAAYLPVLAAFAQGADYRLAHPLVRAELEPAFAAAGWDVLRIDDAVDPALAADPAEEHTFGRFTLSGRAGTAHLATAAYLITARAR